jgi:hypothetical protein
MSTPFDKRFLNINIDGDVFMAKKYIDMVG